MEEKHAKMIERIYSEVVGDEYTEGLIPKVRRISDKVDRHDIYFKVAIAFFGVVGFIIAVVKDVFSIFQ